MDGDQYRVETVAKGHYAVVRFGPDGRRTVHMTGCRLEAVRMRGELANAEARAFKAGLIVGHSETLARPVFPRAN